MMMPFGLFTVCLRMDHYLFRLRAHTSTANCTVTRTVGYGGRNRKPNVFVGCLVRKLAR